MAKPGERFRAKAAGFLIMAAISALLGYAGARVAAYLNVGGQGDAAALARLVENPLAAFADKPFSVDLGSMPVMAVAVACAALPWLMLMMFGVSRQKLDNEDTGKEHGDDRLATVKEMSAARDGRNLCNNILYSEHTGIVLNPYDKKTRAAVEGRNLNACTFGISGLGKTFNLVKPNILQATGSALEPMPYGIRNVPAHFALTRPGCAIAEAARKHGAKEARTQDGKAPREQGGKLARKQEGKLSRLLARKAPEGIGAGFDIVNTDPKGDNVRDVGWALLDAGFEVKVVNTIDFEEGLHMNPLAYIGTRLVDSKAASEVKIDVSASAPDANGEVVERKIESMDFTDERHLQAEKTAKADDDGAWVLNAKMSLETEVLELSEVERTSKTLDELDEAIERAEPGSAEAEKLRAQRDMKWMECDMGSYVVRDEQAGGEGKYRLVEGNGCSKVKGAVETMRYRRTTGKVEVTFQNNGRRPIPAEVKIALDPSLVVTGITAATSGTLDFPKAPDGTLTTSGTFTWHLPAAIAKPKDASSSEHKAEKLAFDVHIRPTKVADGVWLTKTVDCLCANLQGTDAAANKSEDPFWEDTKRLCFMSLIAFLFERYDASQQTLPEMMKLLNIALDEETRDPGVKSPLAVLMEMWETGLSYEDSPPERGEGGGMVSGGRWVDAGCGAHSRDDSMALHCFHAFMSGAPETVQSIVISCQAALVNLLSDDVKEMLSYDELHLETLGDADQKQAIFIVTKDTDSPFDFLTALVTFQAIDIAQEKAYRRYGGKLPRHVRFELDEVANIGKIPILVRAMAVVRSRNISISVYLQSKAQLAMVYGEKEADVMLDNCSAILFLGAQTKDTLEEMSAKVGVETVQSRLLQRSSQDNALVGSMSEQVTSNERRVMSSSQLSRMTRGWMMVFLFNERAAYDHKVKTLEHPLYAYIDPESKRRDWRMPLPVYTERFDYARYRKGEYGAGSPARRES